MRFSRILVATAVFSLLLPLSLLAKDHSTKHSIDVQLYQPANVAGTVLEPGQYKVEWTGTGPAVKAEFKLNGKVIATAPAIASELAKSEPNSVKVQKQADGAQTITGITGKKEALKFGTETSTENQTTAQ